MYDIDKKMNMPEPRTIYSRLKASAKKRNIPFSLTLTDIYAFDFPLVCPILQIPLGWYRGNARDNSYSFDRINSSLGYEFDNIQIISLKANRAKNDLTEDEIKKFISYYQ
jgi:hypothetical protein